MRILILHNKYRHIGGEDTVVEQEANLLIDAGHKVRVEMFSNDAIEGVAGKLQAMLSTRGNKKSARQVTDLCADFRPDVVHIHNFFPMLSPAAHLAASKSSAAVVQTLHNFRLVCAGAMFLRNGAICEDCLDTAGGPALRHRCYRGSLPGTAGVLAMQRATVGSRLWLNSVDRLIALTEFGRKKFIEAGLPAEKIVVKPNFVAASDAGPPISTRPPGALFVGRLSQEKGVRHLVEAWRTLPDVPLTIIGQGPEESWLRANAPAHVTFTGGLARDNVLDRIRAARLLVFPSLWYEGFPMTLAEALACSTPVLAADIGAAREIVTGGKFGALYPPGDAAALSAMALQLLSGNIENMSIAARAEYEKLYCPKQNLTALENIYSEAKASKNVFPMS